MSKAFTKEPDGEEPEDAPETDSALSPGSKNYVTPQGFAVLQAELRQLMRIERPKIVEVVSWAAGNGDRSENGDYIYGKKRLREIDRRVRYLTKRLESAEVVDPVRQQNLRQVFFGATVTYVDEVDVTHRVMLVGVDEADAAQGKISWQAPLARALLRAHIGDTVTLRSPKGETALEIMAIEYVSARLCEPY